MIHPPNRHKEPERGVKISGGIGIRLLRYQRSNLIVHDSSRITVNGSGLWHPHAFDIEDIVGCIDISGSDEKLYSTGKRETRRLTAFVVASDHRVDAN